MCGKGFSKSKSLTKLTQSEANPFKCHFWDKRFTESGNLHTHNQSHSWAKVFYCDLCGKEFTQSGSLTTHVWQGIY